MGPTRRVALKIPPVPRLGDGRFFFAVKRKFGKAEDPETPGSGLFSAWGPWRNGRQPGMRATGQGVPLTAAQAHRFPPLGGRRKPCPRPSVHPRGAPSQTGIGTATTVMEGCRKGMTPGKRVRPGEK